MYRKKNIQGKKLVSYFKKVIAIVENKVLKLLTISRDVKNSKKKYSFLDISSILFH